jgi:hypothetical protein
MLCIIFLNKQKKKILKQLLLKLKNVEVNNRIYSFFSMMNLGLDKIENLQTHSNSDIYHQSYEILEKFFSNEIVRLN